MKEFFKLLCSESGLLKVIAVAERTPCFIRRHSITAVMADKALCAVTSVVMERHRDGTILAGKGFTAVFAYESSRKASPVKEQDDLLIL